MSDDEILELFGQTADTERTTPEVATQLGISKPATWKRLAELHDRGLLEKHPPTGLRTEAWSISDAGREYLEERSTDES